MKIFFILNTTLKSMMNDKLSLHGFLHCYEKRLIKTINKMIPEVEFQVGFVDLAYSGLSQSLVKGS